MVFEMAKMASIALLMIGLAMAGPIGASTYYNSAGYANTQYASNPAVYSKGQLSSYYSFPMSSYQNEATYYYTTPRPYSQTLSPYSPMKDRYSQSYYPSATTPASSYYPYSYSHNTYYPSTTPVSVYYPTQKPSYTQQSSYYKPADPVRLYYPSLVYPTSAYYSASKGSPVYYQSAYVTDAYTKTPVSYKPSAEQYPYNYQQPAYSASSSTPGSYYKVETSYTTTPAYQYEQHYAQPSYAQSPYAPSTEASAYQSEQNYYAASTEDYQAYNQQQAPYPKAARHYGANEEFDNSNQNSQEKNYESVTEEPAYGNA